VSEIPADASYTALRTFWESMEASGLSWHRLVDEALRKAVAAATPLIAAAERERIVAQLGRRAGELASMLAIDDQADHDRNISIGALRYAIEDLTP
jgi:hypothetical protein